MHIRWLEDSLKKDILLNPSGYHIEGRVNIFQQRNSVVCSEGVEYNVPHC